MHSEKNIPLSAHELRDAVRHGQRFDPARLDRILRPEDNRGVIEVQAGASWKAIANLLRPGDEESEAASLRATMRTIGESIARNTAGPCGRPAVTHVESLTLITPEGELRQINRVAHSGLFALVVGGQGLFGTLYSATLRVNSLLRSADETIKSEVPAPSHSGEDTLQLLIPPEALERFVANAQARCEDWRVGVEGVDVRHTLPEEDTFLRWARRQYTEIGLRLSAFSTIGGAVRSTQLRRELIDAAITAGGSFQITHTPEATREQVEACYPELPSFLAEKRRMDPSEKLVNGWYLHHRSLFDRKSCEVRWTERSAT
jgi:FAD/FMN-containing dehydrogenase